MRLIFALLAIGLALPAPAHTAEAFAPGAVIAGRAVALDGDTIRLFRDGEDPVDVRLWGIDAPEMGAENGHGWAARAELDDFLSGPDGQAAAGGGGMTRGDSAPTDPVVACTVADTDRHKRPVATCAAGAARIDLGLWMIRVGWAVEYRKYTRPAPSADTGRWAVEYAKAERQARAGREGRWKLIFAE